MESVEKLVWKYIELKNFRGSGAVDIFKQP